MKKQSSAIVSENHLLTESDACAYLRIRPRQLYTWRKQGLIPYIKIGKALRFRKADVDAALERMRIAG
jgi:excisionase family DNA binding protein